MSVAIDETKFLEWFFSGSDQEIKELILSIGQEARENLEERGTFSLTTEDLIAMSGDVYLDELTTKNEQL